MSGRRVIPVFFSLILTPGAFADDAALDGQDPVAYFERTATHAVQGGTAHSETFRGATYLFADEASVQAFRSDPESYIPAYGGSDPVALATRDALVAGDPDIFTVMDHELFVFADSASRERWLRDFDALRQQADPNWRRRHPSVEMVVPPDRHPRGLEKYLVKDDLGAAGYDPVAYFPEGGGAAIKGEKGITQAYRGVTYRFASEAHRARFVQHPTAYEPAYGGWCAYAMAKSDYTKPNPKRFVIQDGRLMLFYDGFLGDTLKSWNKEGPASLEVAADRYWKSESGESP
ncbi:MAG: hypothetical protein KDA21_12455 [Phycisphaerales bacterium]|nr:hypothetical protein [Phycisphaerales bacterium]